MKDATEHALIRRIEALESEVAEQRLELRRLGGLPDGASGEEEADGRPVRSEDRSSGAEPEVRERLRLPGALVGLRSWEWWLNKVGVGLLLLGVAFLFKFSVDRGWLTPEVRVGIGLAIGMVLLGAGLKVYGERRAFGQVLLGGGIGAFYITGFAAFQLYALVAYPVAFAFMVAVTLLAFALSLRQDGMALALVGAAGGFGTPFVLYVGAGTLGGLVLYTCLVLVGTAAIYLYKGWRALLLFSAAAVWTIFLAGYDNFIYFSTPSAVEGRLPLQLGVSFAWLLLWGVSVSREVLRRRDVRWAFPEPGTALDRLFAGDERAFGSGVVAHLLCVAGSLLVLAFTGAIWDLESGNLGLVALGGTAVYALAALVLRRVERNGWLSYVHALTALLLATLSAVLILDGDALFFALALEAASLHLASRRLADRVLAAVGHVLFTVVGGWLLWRICSGVLESAFFSEDAVVFDAGSWTDLAAIALAFATSVLVASSRTRWVYGILVHASLLGWLWRELGALPDGDAYVSLAWGTYAVGLLITGLRWDLAGIPRLGLATLFVVVGKLFLVDLAWVGTAWRILLFLGFGGLFLVLSYYLQSLWRPGKDAGGETKDDAGPGWPEESGL